MDTPTPGRGSETSLAQGILTRYSRFSAQRPHTQMLRRIYRMQADRLSLASAIQRRWLPTSAPPYQARVTLPYFQPIPAASAGLQTPVQRASDPAPVARVVTSSAVPVPTRSSASPPSTTVQTSPIQRASASPSAVVQQTATGGVLQSAPTVQFVPLIQRTPVMRASPSVVPRTPEPPSVAPARPLPIQHQPVPVQLSVLPIQLSAMSPTAIPSAPPAAPVRTLPGQSAGVIPTVQPQSTPPAAEPLVRVANPLGPATIARRVSGPDNPVSGAGTTGASPLPVVRSSRTAPPLSTVILQRHMVTGQRYAEPQSVSATSTGPTSSGMSAAPVQLRRAAGRSNQQFAGALPLARMMTPMPGTAFGQPVARQPLGGQQSVSATAQQPALPLVLSAVQRQTDMQSGSAAMANNGSAPASMQASASTEAAGESEAGQKNVEEIVDKVWRRLMRWLAVEGERRGGRLWP